MDYIDYYHYNMYSHNCPVCGNIRSVDLIQDENLYCFSCDRRFGYSYTYEIYFEKPKFSRIKSKLKEMSDRFINYIAKKFNLEYVVFGKKLVKYRSNDKKTVRIPEGVRVIGKAVFIYHSEIEEIILPKSLRKINKAAFSNCTNLKVIVIPRYVEKLDAWAFWKCENLTYVQLPKKLRYIGMGVFCDNYRLNKIYIPKKVKVIKSHTFKRCRSLTDITGFAGVKRIGKEAFKGCAELSNITLPEEAKIADNAFDGCIKLDLDN